MTDYIGYAAVKGITRQDMANVVSKHFTNFTKVQMAFASHPEVYALQLIPEAEKLIEDRYGKGPGLSISKKGRNHGNKNKQHRLYLRLDDATRSRLQSLYERMAFATMQDLLEAAVSEFITNHEVAA